ncbi:hypothetical protein EDF88_0984 [Buttiauxella sp. BIGb0552]|uniref:hypothetical protein n=1 Tax=Buttiauxella sp. BIGb0552 TaxID=2485120 RepID=UPI0010663E83|nr:hypothetical protein [Buttiauxella sp. BIGb0552]TDX18498.1 hypothetical protein EDF88_0984 [Buttiauxella sp. BIGb0552]
MSEMNFEAIGRCEYLRNELSNIVSKRHTAYSRMTSAYNARGSSHVYDSITTTDIEKMQSAFEELKSLEVEMLKLVAEYNEWAPQAGKSLIRQSKY